MTFTKEEIKAQQDFVQAISYQKEVAINAYYDAKDYCEKITIKYEAEKVKLNSMTKEQNV